MLQLVVLAHTLGDTLVDTFGEVSFFALAEFVAGTASQEAGSLAAVMAAVATTFVVVVVETVLASVACRREHR